MTAPLDEKTLSLQKRDLRGSRLRFLMLTSGAKEQVAAILTQLVSPWGSVDPLCDHWMPEGFLHPEEAKLGECDRFLSADKRKTLTEWWLRDPERANTPNWDLVSTCTIEDKPGLILIEGKAHTGELRKEGKSGGNEENDKQIRRAIAEANQGLNETNEGLKQIPSGWSLSAESDYQLCNRFAWAWKVATLGVPTILVYLGFLHATEMLDQGKPFESPEEWNKTIQEHACNAVPSSAWESRPQTNNPPLWPLIRSLDHQWCVGR